MQMAQVIAVAIVCSGAAYSSNVIAADSWTTLVKRPLTPQGPNQQSQVGEHDRSTWASHEGRHHYRRADRHHRSGRGDHSGAPDHHRGGHHNQRSRWLYEGENVANSNHSIKHYAWERRVGDGPYDKISLHRFVQQKSNGRPRPKQPAHDRRKVLFILPGTWAEATTGPAANSSTYFFAAHGYDVYSIDYRTSYIPQIPYDEFDALDLEKELRSAASWTYGVFREDIKAAVEQAKRISGARRVFMGGQSRGGTQVYIYAAKYNDDLKGMIGLDGGPIYRTPGDSSEQISKSEYDEKLAALRQGNSDTPILSEVSLYQSAQIAKVLPYAEASLGGPLPTAGELSHGLPPDGSAIDTISDYVTYQAYWLWGEGIVTNPYMPYPGGKGEAYITKADLIDIQGSLIRYWPNVQNIEGDIMDAYANVPYLDYDDTQDITLPIIHFASELGCADGSCLSSDNPYSTSSSDVTVKYLPNYGHLDVFAGTHSTEDLRLPLLHWMNRRL